MKMFKESSESCHLPDELRTNWLAILVVSYAIIILGSARGETLIIPAGAETRENTHASAYPFAGPGNLASQQVYPSSLFPALSQPGQLFQLDGIAFRLSSGGNLGLGSSADFDRVQIRVSSSFGPFSSNLGQNHGANAAIVFDGPLSLTGTVPAGTTPSAFELEMDFTSPFFYAPSSGSLVIEIRKYGSTGEFLSGVGAGQIPGGIFFGEDVFGVHPGGNLGLETAFLIQIVPEPSTCALFVVGLLLISRSRRAERNTN